LKWLWFEQGRKGVYPSYHTAPTILRISAQPTDHAVAHIIRSSNFRKDLSRLSTSDCLSPLVSLGLRPRITPLAFACSRPSPVRVRISSRSNSAGLPKTVSIKATVRRRGVSPGVSSRRKIAASMAVLGVRLRSQLSHYGAPDPVDFTPRLSSCRFHDASTNEFSGQNAVNKRPLKTICFQGLVVWLRG
jgi:hypothetical protein